MRAIYATDGYLGSPLPPAGASERRNQARRPATHLKVRGPLHRCLHPTDRRSIYSNVTDTGHTLCEQARPTDEALGA
ncbi:hypothetical protein [Streptomyces sp. NBC_00285]|uniref:hypothetical protein n=1 Tax=Streptomyces sp. NBC_00285 TaxID=2975700 RepID=UPI003FA6EF77